MIVVGSMMSMFVDTERDTSKDDEFSGSTIISPIDGPWGDGGDWVMAENSWEGMVMRIIKIKFFLYFL